MRAIRLLARLTGLAAGVWLVSDWAMRAQAALPFVQGMEIGPVLLAVLLNLPGNAVQGGGGVGRLAPGCGPATGPCRPGHANAGPVTPTVFRLPHGGRLSLFSVRAQFGSAEEVSLPGVTRELMFPADDQARAWLEGAARS